MAVKAFGFKRIAKEPLKPVTPVEPVTIAGVPIPSQDELAKMSAEEAYTKGKQLGDLVKAMLQTGKPVRTITTANVAPAAVTNSHVTLLFKRSDTGVGYKQWSIWQDGNDVVVEWGHCDKKKIQKRYPFVNRPHLMSNWVREAVQKKLKEGYKYSK